MRGSQPERGGGRWPTNRHTGRVRIAAEGRYCVGPAAVVTSIEPLEVGDRRLCGGIAELEAGGVLVLREHLARRGIPQLDGAAAGAQAKRGPRRQHRARA